MRSLIAFVSQIERFADNRRPPVPLFARGPCRAALIGDTGAVVDPRLRIHEIAGLRVVEASIMPTIPSGNTNAPAIMIAADARADASAS